MTVFKILVNFGLAVKHLAKIKNKNKKAAGK